MKALVTVASKHGATAEIGRAIADKLREGGIYVAEETPEHVYSLKEFDAVIVGSALYMGRWMGEARDLIRDNAETLRAKSVWLFASGPVTPVDDEGDAAEGNKLRELVGARDARVFAGELKKESLGLVEKGIVRMIGSPWGDYRPWDEIRAWAAGIAEELTAAPVG